MSSFANNLAYLCNINIKGDPEKKQIIIELEDCHNLGTVEQNVVQAQRILSWIQKLEMSEKKTHVLIESQDFFGIDFSLDDSIQILNSFIAQKYDLTQQFDIKRMTSHPLGNDYNPRFTTLMGWGLPYEIALNFRKSNYISMSGINFSSVIRSIDPREPVKDFFSTFNDIKLDLKQLLYCQDNNCAECCDAKKQKCIDFISINEMLNNLFNKILFLNTKKDNKLISVLYKLYNDLSWEFKNICSIFYQFAQNCGGITSNEIFNLYFSNEELYNDLKGKIKDYNFLLQSLEFCYLAESAKYDSASTIIWMGGSAHANNASKYQTELGYVNLYNDGWSVDQLIDWVQDDINYTSGIVALSPKLEHTINNAIDIAFLNLEYYREKLNRYKQN